VICQRKLNLRLDRELCKEQCDTDMYKLKNINNKIFHHNLIKISEYIINDNDRHENCHQKHISKCN